MFSRQLASHFSFFFTFVFHFMLDPDPNPVPEPKCITVPVLLGIKVAVPAFPVLQHCQVQGPSPYWIRPKLVTRGSCVTFTGFFGKYLCSKSIGNLALVSRVDVKFDMKENGKNHHENSERQLKKGTLPVRYERFLQC